jgi:hypothetical protein
MTQHTESGAAGMNRACYRLLQLAALGGGVTSWRRRSCPRHRRVSPAAMCSRWTPRAAWSTPLSGRAATASASVSRMKFTAPAGETATLIVPGAAEPFQNVAIGK